MNTSNSISELAKALTKVQAALDGVARQREGYQYMYADLNGIWDSIRVPLTNNGLSIIQSTKLGEADAPIIVTRLLHTSGEWVEGELLVRPVKNEPRAIGSAITYARKYSLMGIVGCSPVDDDAEAASKPATKPNKPSQAKLDRFHALVEECLSQGIDAKALQGISSKSTSADVDEAGKFNKALLDTVIGGPPQ